MTSEEKSVHDICHATAYLATAHPAVHHIQNDWDHAELAGRIATWFENQLEDIITLRHAKNMRRLLIRFGLVAGAYLRREEVLSSLHETDPTELGHALYEHLKKFD